MAIQIRGSQIRNDAIDASKIADNSITATQMALGGAFVFTTLSANSPTADAHVATKAYVDGVAQGLDAKDSVRVATTATGTLTSAFANGQTVDGVTLSTGDRILIKNQSTGSENGIYTVNASGAPSRASDGGNGEINGGTYVFVEEGTTNANRGFVCTNTGSVTVGTTALTFSQFSGAGQITAGAAMTKSGDTLNVAVDDSSIEVSSDALRIKASGVTSAMLAGSIANGKLANSTISGVALGANLNALSKATNGGVNFTSYNGSAAVSNLALDLSDLAAATVNVGADSIAIYDADADVTAKESIADLVSAMAGNGLAASSGVLAVGVDDSSIELNSDAIRIKASGVTNSMLANSTISGVALGANLNALSKATNGGVNFTSYNGSAAVSDLSLDLDDLAAADVNVGADSIAIIDADDSNGSKKESIADLVTAMAGNGLAASSGVLAVGVDDSSIELNSDAVRIKASGVTNAMLAGSIANGKLANSTISGVALGANLNSLSKATNGGVNFSSYNGSAAVSNLALDLSDLAAAAVNVGADSIAIYDADADVTGKETIADLITAVAGDGLAASSGVLAVGVDDSTIELNSDALRIKAGGVTSAKIANDAVGLAQLGISPKADKLTGDGSAAAFDLSSRIATAQLSDFKNLVKVFRNGVRVEQVTSSASGQDEYVVDDNAGSSKTRITFGSAPDSGDVIFVDYWV